MQIGKELLISLAPHFVKEAINVGRRLVAPCMAYEFSRFHRAVKPIARFTVQVALSQPL